MVTGLLLCMAWYYTILSGFFILYCPVMYLMFLNHRLYRKIVDALFAIWELCPVGLFQYCCDTELHHFGDYVNADEKTIIVMNHRTRVDWNYLWIALYHATQNPDSDLCTCKQAIENSTEARSALNFGGKSKLKFVLKDEIKNVPGMGKSLFIIKEQDTLGMRKIVLLTKKQPLNVLFGWIMQLNYFLYVKRNWREDQVSLSQFVEYYHQLNSDYRLVLFPEGTDLSDDNRSRSEKYALVNKLQHYEFVLHPRTTGWIALCTRLRESGLASVYDVTIAYDTPAQTEMDLLKGRKPKNVYFHCKRYSIEELPLDEVNLRSWLNDRWREKEYSLRKFYNEGKFIDSRSNRSPPYRSPRSLLAAKIGLIFWTILDVLFVYSLIISNFFQFWVLYHSFLFIFITWYFGGFHNIQYKLLDSYKL